MPDEGLALQSTSATCLFWNFRWITALDAGGGDQSRHRGDLAPEYLCRSLRSSADALLGALARFRVEGKRLPTVLAAGFGGLSRQFLDRSIAPGPAVRAAEHRHSATLPLLTAIPRTRRPLSSAALHPYPVVPLCRWNTSLPGSTGLWCGPGRRPGSAIFSLRGGRV